MKNEAHDGRYIGAAVGTLEHYLSHHLILPPPPLDRGNAKEERRDSCQGHPDRVFTLLMQL